MRPKHQRESEELALEKERPEISEYKNIYDHERQKKPKKNNNRKFKGEVKVRKEALKLLTTVNLPFGVQQLTKIDYLHQYAPN